MRTDRINFLDIQFDPLSFQQIKSRLQAVTGDSPFAYIVTPNVDHVVRMHREPGLRELYDNADVCVCDSRILKFLARLRGVRLPLVPGSDLTDAIFSDIIRAKDRVAVVGTSGAAISLLEAKFPDVVFLHFEPPMGLRTNPDARRLAADFIAKSKSRFAFIAVGSPQQELIANEVRNNIAATGIGLCIGAGLDFVVGKERRAPRLFQVLGLEWAHRLLSNPRRLWRRYLVEGVRIFPIWLRWRRPRGSGLLTFGLLAGLLALASLAGLSFVKQKQALSSQTVRLPSLRAQTQAAIEALPAPNLLKPVSPEEASKENSERPFAGRTDTPASRFLLKTDADNKARALTCLAQAVYYEAAGEGPDGQRAVAQVVLNRMHHPGFPSTVCGVVYEGSDRATGCQFSFTCDGSMHRIPVQWLWTRSKLIAEDALKGRVFAPVGHSTHYHADYVLPYWADSLDKNVQIGRHIFYRLRSSLGDARAFSQHYGGAEPPFREPGATIVIPQTEETQQLTNALTSDATQSAKPSVERASAAPGSPLVVDSNRGTLLADGNSASSPPTRPKPTTRCTEPVDRKQVSALKADDMRPSLDALRC